MKLTDKITRTQLFQNIRNKLHIIFVTGPRNDAEFLPGALEVSESPPSPIGRAILWSIMVFLVGVVLWASFGKVEVVAVASGQLVPVGEVKLVQASEAGIVREIYVAEGQHVAEGDVLISLDPTSSEADETTLRQKQLHWASEIALCDALLSWDHNLGPNLPDISLPDAASPTIVKLYEERAKQEVTVVINTLASLAADFKRLEAQGQRVEQQVQKYREVLRIDEDLSRTFYDLYKKSASSRTQWLAAEQQRIRNEQDMAATMEQVGEIASARVGIQQEMAKAISVFRSDMLKRKAEVENEYAVITQELAKASRRNTLKVLTAPVSGYVQQLSVHTIGGVVQGAEQLMYIVPDGTELEVKANVLNKDIGFIHEGQVVEIKLDAFPFTEHGTMRGEVKTISADATLTEEGELLYPCAIKIVNNNIYVAGEIITARPGMMAQTEIVLRDRRLISYFLSPLLKHTSESLRER